MNAAGDKIYHITTHEQWEAAQAGGVYRGDTLDSEGFIHASLARQVAGSANLFFVGRSGLVLLEIDPARVGAEIRYEAAPSGERFPHIYGPLEVEAVLRVVALEPGPDGRFTWAQEVG
jgi:uncharacterized protein (DUF952 family)